MHVPTGSCQLVGGEEASLPSTKGGREERPWEQQGPTQAVCLFMLYKEMYGRIFKSLIS